MRKTETLKYRVTGAGCFPFDMLRYDGAYPADQTASARIENTTWAAREQQTPEQRAERQPIELVATFNGCPNADRWQSFGWRVTEVWNGYEWTPYHGQSVRK